MTTPTLAAHPAPDLEPGQTQALNCIPDGKYGKYTTVTAEATF